MEPIREHKVFEWIRDHFDFSHLCSLIHSIHILFSPSVNNSLQDKKLSHHNDGHIIGKRIFGAIILCVNYSDPHKKGGYYFLRISGSWMPRVRICAKCLVFKVLGFYRGIKDRRIQS